LRNKRKGDQKVLGKKINGSGFTFNDVKKYRLGFKIFYWILFFKVIKMSFVGRNMILEVNEMFFGGK